MLRDQDTQTHGPDAIAERVQTALSGATKLTLDSNNQLSSHPLHEPLPEVHEEYNEPVDKIAAYFQSRPVRDNSDIYMGVSVMSEEEIKARTIPKTHTKWHSCNSAG
jgi:hypothetical protein